MPKSVFSLGLMLFLNTLSLCACNGGSASQTKEPIPALKPVASSTSEAIAASSPTPLTGASLVPTTSKAIAASSLPVSADPELRASWVSGAATIQLRGSTPAPLTTTLALGLSDVIGAIITTPKNSTATLLLPDDSILEVGPETRILFSDNERREVTLVYGTLHVQMKKESTDRAGMQVRTLAGLVRGPQADFTVVAASEVLVWVERGVVYTGDELNDLIQQTDAAELVIQLAAAGKEIPKPEKRPSVYAKIDPGFSTILSRVQPPLMEEKYFTEKERSAWLAASFKGWETMTATKLSSTLKAIDENLAQTKKYLEKISADKEKNITFIEELKAARATNDRTKITEIQGEITRYSRYTLALKRQSHLLTLEAWMMFEALSYTNDRSAPGSSNKKVFAKEEQRMIKTTESIVSYQAETAHLRPRTRSPVGFQLPPSTAP